ncbi:GGDEF and EAL domain-containing protein [Alcaligenaceae bacterium C4P045]|nr:GGDEF and EAL domain-containing protein [Alcaligenaceae bacterium C4P045]
MSAPNLSQDTDGHLESIRQTRIDDLRLTDDINDSVFDLIVETAADYFDAPIVLISILDRQRQWFRAKLGIEKSETPRKDAFCNYTISSPKIMEIVDSHADPRFVRNELVVGEPNIRYYAGAPLITHDGLALGSLCIIDTKPRVSMSPRERRMLEHLRDMAMARIESLRIGSFIDEPSGLYNRTRLQLDVDEHLKADQRVMAVAADMQSLPFLNDVIKTLGYTFTNDLMMAMRDRFLDVLPTGATLYKISPTRFAFVLLSENRRNAPAILQQLLHSFAKPVECKGIPVQANLALGVLDLGAPDAGRMDLLRLIVSAADDARHRNVGIAWHDPVLDAAQQRAFVLLSSLADALQNGTQFWLAYQPRIDLQSGSCTSVEALLRWDHPTLGSISPVEFVPLAEKTALIKPLGQWVLAEVVRQQLEWHAEGVTLQIGMNVSADDLHGTEFVRELERLIETDLISPADLGLEFTESVLIRNVDDTRRVLQRVRQLGFEMAIDDFGTGYSNWSYLRQLPATTVKLDRSFLSGIETDDQAQRLLMTVIMFAKGLGYRTVVEGIETPEQLSLVRGWGCDEAQGYLFARPMRASSLVSWLQMFDASDVTFRDYH